MAYNIVVVACGVLVAAITFVLLSLAVRMERQSIGRRNLVEQYRGRLSLTPTTYENNTR
jgi:hypothetical protein